MSEVSLRQIQIKVIEKVREAIANGKTDIFIQAPTGTGKGLIALDLSRDFTSYMLTSEKSLQKQYEEDCERYNVHKPAKSICGIDTYTCSMNNEKFSLGVCRTLGMTTGQALKLPCAGTCEYLQRWQAAKASPRAIMNYSYYLLQMNYVLDKLGDKAPFSERQLVICDEAHKMPDIIESHFACTVDLKVIDRINRVITQLYEGGFSNHNIVVTQLSSAIYNCLGVRLKAPAEEHLDALRTLYRAFEHIQCAVVQFKEEQVKHHTPKGKTISDLSSFSRKLPKALRGLFRLADGIKDRCCKLEDYIAIIENDGLENLIVDDEKQESRTYHNLSDADLFKKHFRKFSDIRIYMSASLQPELLIKRWEIDPEVAHVLDVQSEWEVARSRVVLCDTANMSFKHGTESITKSIRKIDELLDLHKEHRGVIHTTSNALAEDVISRSKFKRRLISYADTAEKIEILAKFDTYPPDAVLIGPSLTTGIDLKDDLARFNIVMKLSFPNMKSALWAKRFECKYHIYVGETASVLEQACGRTTRSASDYSISYVLDSRAERFIKEHHKYFSPGFLKRIQLEKP